MFHYSFAGYSFYISDTLHPVINEEADQFLIVHPVHHTICFSVKLVEEKRLEIHSFFGLRHEIRGKAIYIYQSLYDQGDEIDEEDQSLPF